MYFLKGWGNPDRLQWRLKVELWTCYLSFSWETKVIDPDKVHADKMLVYFVCVILKVKSNGHVVSHIPNTYLPHKDKLSQNDPDVTWHEILFFTSSKLTMKFWWNKMSGCGPFAIILPPPPFLSTGVSQIQGVVTTRVIIGKLTCNSPLCLSILWWSLKGSLETPRIFWPCLQC